MFQFYHCRESEKRPDTTTQSLQFLPLKESERTSRDDKDISFISVKKVDCGLIEGLYPTLVCTPREKLTWYLTLCSCESETRLELTKTGVDQ